VSNSENRTKVNSQYRYHIQGEHQERTADAAMAADSVEGAIGRNSQFSVLSSSAVATCNTRLMGATEKARVENAIRLKMQG